MLRVVAVCLLVISMAGFFTGYYREMGGLAIFQAVMYVSGFFGLWVLARKRDALERPKPENSEAQNL